MYPIINLTLVQENMFGRNKAFTQLPHTYILT